MHAAHGTGEPQTREEPSSGDHRAAPGESGSASVIVLSVGLSLLVIALGLCAVASAIGLRHQAQSAADLAALAGAGRIGVVGEPCDAAAEIAALNRVELTSCALDLSPDGRSGTVDVDVRARARIAGVRGSEATARSRAERMPGLPDA